MHDRPRAAVGVQDAVTPTTAFALSSATVDAGSSRSTLPALIVQREPRRGFRIDFESQAQRQLRAQARTNTAKFLSGDGLVKLVMFHSSADVFRPVLSHDAADAFLAAFFRPIVI